MVKTSPLQFLREVRQEAQKVTWPTRRETMVSTGLVIVMVVVAALFFFVVDQLAATAIRFIVDFRI
jgi:preprotein translocase subunit SecE